MALNGAYAGMAQVWAKDAALAYAPLAEHLVARAPAALHGRLALDAGAGSGAAGDAMRAAGAQVLAADIEFDMAAYAAEAGRTVNADVTALPFRSGCFDLVVAAFVVNHLPRPVDGLAELRRVAHSGAAVLVSVFSANRSSAKATVDQVASTYGFVPPPWYDDVQRHATSIGHVDAMTDALRDAGFSIFDVTDEAVDVGLRDPALVVRYRIGLPHLRRFVDALSPDRRRAFLAEATEAVAREGEVFAPKIVEAVAVA